jgi:hypothetical protein
MELDYVVSSVRDIGVIDGELRLLAAVRASIRELGGRPSCRQVDRLLDERLAADSGRAVEHSAG